MKNTNIVTQLKHYEMLRNDAERDYFRAIASMKVLLDSQNVYGIAEFVDSHANAIIENYRNFKKYNDIVNVLRYVAEEE